MARSDPQVNLRLPAELKNSIDQAARVAGRSTNAEVVARLQGSFEGGPAGESDRLALDLSRKVLSLELTAGSAGAFLKLALDHLSADGERKLRGILPTMNEAASLAYAVGKMNGAALADAIKLLLESGGTTEHAQGLYDVVKLLKDSGVDPTPWTQAGNQVKPQP